MPRPNWLSNPWAQNPWFEAVAVAQRRARKRLPSSVYGALVAGSERGQTVNDNTAAFGELGFAPHVVGQTPDRSMATTVMGLPISLPVIISPTGVQAVHPDGEVAVAGAAATRGTVMSLSNFASKSIEKVGEIVHRSPHAALGYYQDEEKTAEAFRGCWFHSGDLGVISEDSFLTIVDRKKNMIKTGGENVASREVEETLYELDGVAEVAVFGINHPHWIEAVTAVVVPKQGSAPLAEHVQAHARTTLAPYKHPKYVVLVDALPKNPSGKVLKRNLREQHAGLATEDGGAQR